MVKTLILYGNNLKRPEYSLHFKIEENLVGISLDSGNPGEKVEVLRRGFFTDYDNELFFTILDSFTSLFLKGWMLTEKKQVSQIWNCLIFIQKNNEVDVHINCPTLLQIIPKSNIENNTPIFKHDIADIRKISFQGIKLKSNCAVLYIFSVGWKRGIYIDFLPLDSDIEYTTGDLSTIFASLYSYLQFPEIHRLEPDIKEKLFEKGWFPFIRLLGNDFEELYMCIKHNLQIVDSELKIVNSFKEETILYMKETWLQKDPFKKHEKIIEKGIERFIAGDYISSISILYPRIEGIMRHIYLGERKKSNSSNLAKKIGSIGNERTIEYGLFMPNDFEDYLKKVYFQSFDLKTGEVNLSRHSLAHGVANEEDFSKIKAFQGILILDQISFYL